MFYIYFLHNCHILAYCGIKIYIQNFESILVHTELKCFSFNSLIPKYDTISKPKTNISIYEYDDRGVIIVIYNILI